MPQQLLQTLGRLAQGLAAAQAARCQQRPAELEPGSTGEMDFETGIHADDPYILAGCLRAVSRAAGHALAGAAKAGRERVDRLEPF